MAESTETLAEWLDTVKDPWIDDWNTILREVIFADDVLKELMMIPYGTKII